MTITMPCPRCDAVIDAADEDDLVAKVQQHVREDHGLDHTMPAKQSSRACAATAPATTPPPERSVSARTWAAAICGWRPPIDELRFRSCPGASPRC